MLHNMESAKIVHLGWIDYGTKAKVAKLVRLAFCQKQERPIKGIPIHCSAGQVWINVTSSRRVLFNFIITPQYQCYSTQLRSATQDGYCPSIQIAANHDHDSQARTLEKAVALEVLVLSRGRLVTLQIFTSVSFFLGELTTLWAS